MQARPACSTCNNVSSVGAHERFMHIDWISYIQLYQTELWGRACTLDKADMTQHPVNHIVSHALIGRHPRCSTKVSILKPDVFSVPSDFPLVLD